MREPKEYLGRPRYQVLQGWEAPCPFCNNAELRIGEKCCWEYFNERLGRWLGLFRDQGDLWITSLQKEVLKELKEGRFQVFYQPQVDMKDGHIVGAEALVRKLGENGELLLPNQFLPFYEQQRVIQYVDLFVLETVCAKLQEWEREGEYLRIAVNFSQVTLEENEITARLTQICQQYGVAPGHIMIEITQNQMKERLETSRELMHRVMKCGFMVALDDFGKQLFSLTALNEFNVDVVKFDQSLIATSDKKRSQIVLKHLLRMCREIGSVHTLAERVEMQNQAELLNHFECEYGQGYYFARPMPVKEFEERLRAHSAGLVLEEESSGSFNPQG